MCLTYNQRQTAFFLNQNVKFFKVYKLITRLEDYFYTPFYNTLVNSGWLIAKGMKEVYYDEYNGGFIHVFHDKSHAILYRNIHREFLIECYGLKRDFVAAGTYDMVFNKIFIPKKELERIERENPRTKQ